MGWFKNLIAGGAGELIEKSGEALDRLVTSDEEREQAKAAIQALTNDHAERMAEAANRFESEVTKRHASDMKSDSWLSKNIRPLSLAFLLIATVMLAYLTTFGELSKLQAEVLAGWRPMLTGLLGTAFVFYFGSRGIEKVQKMRGR